MNVVSYLDGESEEGGEGKIRRGEENNSGREQKGSKMRKKDRS